MRTRKHWDKLDKRKSKRSIKFYNTSRWKRVRNMFRVLFPNCFECGKEGQLVHHNPDLITLLDMGKNPYSFSYLETLCNNCHLVELRCRR